MQHLEAGHLVALAQTPRHGVRRPAPEAIDQPVDPVVRLRLLDRALLHRIGVGLAAPERDAERLADLLARALVVRVGVRERVRRDLAVLELAQDARAGASGGGVYQHVADHVDVHRVARTPVQEPEVVSQLAHGPSLTTYSGA